MEWQEIRKLIKLVESSTIHQVEIEFEGTRIWLSKEDKVEYTVAAPQAGVPIPQQAQTPAIDPALNAAPAVAEPVTSAPQTETRTDYHEIKSPMVGTFYSAPSPDADPYVKVGDRIKSGQALCIVEAMKLMNEIEADVSGTVVEVRGENGKPVEYGQVMFLIDTNA
ncbi:acetyl-CoA carboxylase biotin carboxyl carrier protein [bacterium]|nr:acetyl-CoA carboxylase biotin carboxyl carrier protein [bacterium]